MTTHRGKIGRLPAELREQVNRRLENGEEGKSILLWLNALPEVKAVLTAEFQATPVSPANLTQWRKLGYKDWLRRREAMAMAAEIGELPVAGNSPVVDQIATWGSVRYLMAVREVVQQRAEGQSHLHTIREFTRDAIALRRLEHRTARLQLDRSQLEHVY